MTRNSYLSPKEMRALVPDNDARIAALEAQLAEARDRADRLAEFERQFHLALSANEGLAEKRDAAESRAIAAERGIYSIAARTVCNDSTVPIAQLIPEIMGYLDRADSRLEGLEHAELERDRLQQRVQGLEGALRACERYMTEKGVSHEYPVMINARKALSALPTGEKEKEERDA